MKRLALIILLACCASSVGIATQSSYATWANETLVSGCGFPMGTCGGPPGNLLLSPD